MKVNMSVENEEEQILQDLLRQKLNGSSEISPLPSGELMDRFLNELMVLNDEFVNQREGIVYFKCKRPINNACFFIQMKQRLKIGGM